ncbi:MAG: LamG-like jellyroll fold domain-containing protein [Planctomycetota bacterium]
MPNRIFMLAILPFLLPITVNPTFAQENAAPEPDYRAVVVRFVETLMEKGTDRYGTVHSPMFAACLDLKTLSMPTESPAIPPGPNIRESDRCWQGCNPYLDTLTIRAMYELTRRTGDPKYRDAAEIYLRWFLDHCPSPTTGLLPWGEHTFWNFTTEAVERDNHEFLVWRPLWPEMWDINAPAVRRAIEGIYAHHVFDKKTGLFNRHASYADARKVLVTTEGMPWIKHAGLMAYSLAFLYGKTGEQIHLDRAMQMANLYWNTRDEKTGLPIACIGHSEQPGSGGIAQCASLLAASAASNRDEFRRMAVTYLEIVARRTPTEGNASLSDKSWAIGYGSDGGVFRECQYMLAGYLATSDPDMLRYCEYWARGVMAMEPPAQSTAEAYGRAIRFLAGLSRATGKTEYRDHARRLAALAMERLYHKPSGLFRGMVGYEYYDAQFGIGELLLGLLDLEDDPYRGGALIGASIVSPGLPSGAVKRSVRVAITNSGRSPVKGTVRLETPADWEVEPEAQSFDAPASKEVGDVWIREPGTVEVEFFISVPLQEETSSSPVKVHLSAGGAESNVAAEVLVFGKGDVLDKPFTADEHTIALAHFDKTTDADHPQGAIWEPEGVTLVPDGIFGGGARFATDKSRIRLTFANGVPPEGTVEFFVRPDWTSTPSRDPASDGVQRHLFAWAPMTKDAMLWVYFLDEIGEYTGVRVHGAHGKPNVSRNLAFKKGEWHHLALCWRTAPDGAVTLAYFVDGLRCTQGELAKRGLPVGIRFQNELNIGAYPGCPANADIDEARVSSTARHERGIVVIPLEKQ